MSRENEPAVQLEAMIDKYSLAKVCDMLAGICGEKKASHIEEKWQAYPLAERWEHASSRFRVLAATLRAKRL
jgi:hypothetical protein